MTRLIFASDSHGHFIDYFAEQCMDGEYAHIIHLGDYVRDAEELEQRVHRNVIHVAGNCDMFSRCAKEAMLRVEDVKILICHGDKFNVKSSLYGLSLRAREVGAKLALYGHTHFADVTDDGGIILANPGALQNGRYAVAEIDGENINIIQRYIP